MIRKYLTKILKKEINDLINSSYINEECSKDLNLYNIRLIAEFSNDYSRIVDDLKKNDKNLRHFLIEYKKTFF